METKNQESIKENFIKIPVIKAGEKEKYRELLICLDNIEYIIDLNNDYKRQKEWLEKNGEHVPKTLIILKNKEKFVTCFDIFFITEEISKTERDEKEKEEAISKKAQENQTMELKNIKRYIKRMVLASDLSRTIIQQKDVDFLLSKDNVVLQESGKSKDLLCLKFDEILNAKYSNIELTSKDDNLETTLYIPVSYDDGYINEIFRISMNRKERNEFNFIKSCLTARFQKSGKFINNFGYSYDVLDHIFNDGEKQILEYEDDLEDL